MEFVCGFTMALLIGAGAVSALVFALRRGIQPLAGLVMGPAGDAGDAALEELRRADPHLARTIELAARVRVEAVPEEIQPRWIDAIGAEPNAESARNVARRFIENPDVADVVTELARWKPRRRRGGVDLRESEYEESLARFLQKPASLLRDQIDRQRRLKWGSEDGADRTAIPDFIVRDKVLLELKGDLTRSDAADRALGQMLRYLLAWKNEGSGAGVLVICGDAPPEMRFLVRTYVNVWRTRLHLPVTVYFKRAETVQDVGMEFAEERIDELL